MSHQDEPIIRRRVPPASNRRRTGLLSHAADVTSQNGEDGIIRRVFEMLPFQSQRVCVDVGAWDGRHLSNTFSLLNHDNVDQGETTKWRGVLIEADRDKFQQLTALYPPHSGNICIRKTVSCHVDSSSSLRRILNNVDLEKEFDFLCIDVDGIDYWLLHDLLGCDNDDADGQMSNKNNQYNQPTDNCSNNTQLRRKSYRPKLICIEFNPSMPLDLIYIQPRNDAIRHGSSLSALVELANSSEYTLIETTVFNAFFIQSRLYQQYFKEEVPDTSIETLHEVTMGTSLYQLYDGSIRLWGCRKMLWHRLPLDEKKMQMLTADEKEFPFAPNDNDDNLRCNRASLDLDINKSAIDMSPYCCISPTCDENLSIAKQKCYTKLISTLQKDGFALVKGTNMPSDICRKALTAAKSFLHQADESVRRSCLTKDRARRGYSPICTENFASLIGEKAPNDLVKKFRVGPEEKYMDGRCEQKESSLSSLHQPNAWPSEEVWDQSSHFRSIIEEYYEMLRVIADSILCAICDGLVDENTNLEESVRVISESINNKQGTDGNRMTNHTSILTLLGYQPGSRHKKGSKGYLNPLVAAHTDVGMITVLLFDSGKCATLQRSSSVAFEGGDKKEWLDVNLPSTISDPIFVVNVGDCLSELTGGYLRSTLHRVVPCPSKTSTADLDVVRTSLALFVGLEPSVQLVLPESANLSYEEWRRRRIARALDVIKT